MTRSFAAFVLIAGGLLLIPSGHAAGPASLVAKDQAGLALQGYDVVAYFTDNRAVRGDARYTSGYGGATYRFASAGHLALFVKDPVRYLPQYGGFCAFGASQREGHTAIADPEAFTVVDGKLYLNYNKEVQKVWNRDREKSIRQANINWERLRAGSKP